MEKECNEYKEIFEVGLSALIKTHIFTFNNEIITKVPVLCFMNIFVKVEYEKIMNKILI